MAAFVLCAGFRTPSGRGFSLPAGPTSRAAVSSSDDRLNEDRMNGMLVRSLGILFCALLLAAPAGAATCGGDFNAFLSAVAREAAAAGVSRSVVESAFSGLTPDGTVLAFDPRQRGTFRKSFEDT